MLDVFFYIIYELLGPAMNQTKLYIHSSYTAWKVSLFGLFMVRIVQLRENKDQKNYEYGNFSRSVSLCVWTKKLLRMILERITKKHVDKVLNFALFRNKDKNRLSVSSMICEFMLWISSFKLNIQVTLKDLRLKT